MEKTKNAVKDLLILYKAICVKEEQLEKLGLKLDFRWEESVSDIALDIIGFPKDNSTEFDFSYMSNPEYVKPTPELRQDFENLSTRDWLGDKIYDYAFDNEGCMSIDELVDWLYNEKQNL